ncbi:hypothetical protein PMAYCL1PPCAC_25114, partial [Pristionchus mayeri]
SMEPPPAYEEKPEDHAGTSAQTVSISMPPTQPAPPQYNEALNASTTPPVCTDPPVFPIYLDQPGHPDPRYEDDRGMARLWKLMVVIGGTMAILICVAVVATWISFAMIR